MAKRPGRGLIDRMDVWNEKLGYENENLRLQKIWEKRPGGGGKDIRLLFYILVHGGPATLLPLFILLIHI